MMMDRVRQPSAKSDVHSVQNRLSSCTGGPVSSRVRAGVGLLRLRWSREPRAVRRRGSPPLSGRACHGRVGQAAARRGEANLQRGEVRQLRDDELQRAENRDPGLQAGATMRPVADTPWRLAGADMKLRRACSVRSQGPGAGPQAGWYRRYSACPRGAPRQVFRPPPLSLEHSQSHGTCGRTANLERSCCCQLPHTHSCKPAWQQVLQPHSRVSNKQAPAPIKAARCAQQPRTQYTAFRPRPWRRCRATHLHALPGDNLDRQVVAHGCELLEEYGRPVAWHPFALAHAN